MKQGKSVQAAVAVIENVDVILDVMNLIGKIIASGTSSQGRPSLDIASAPSLNDFSLGCAAAAAEEEKEMRAQDTPCSTPIFQRLSLGEHDQRHHGENSPLEPMYMARLSLPMTVSDGGGGLGSIATSPKPIPARTPNPSPKEPEMLAHRSSAPHPNWRKSGMDMYDYRGLASDLCRSP
eukprot:gene8519-4816_t